METRSGSPWSTPDIVAGFAQSQPNATLMRFAEDQVRHSPVRQVIDIGCGAGRNAAPLAATGWKVIGVDLSEPMLRACKARAVRDGVIDAVHVMLASMDALPVRDATCDLVVAHGIWNLAASVTQFRRSVSEAARVARIGAGLFVFTFSRSTLSPNAESLPGQPFVFTQFSGQPQCFLTEEQLLTELGAVGFMRDTRVPLREHNRARPGALLTAQGPVIYEGAFRLQA